MTVTFRFKDRFADEFARLPAEMQDRVDDFLDIYETHGLQDFSKYPGKIVQSWHTLAPGHPNYHFAYSNDLWHYHVGHPNYYTPSLWGTYQTSDWLLHFQWPGWTKGPHIELVDLYQHYDSNGNFWLPRQDFVQG